MFRFKTLMLFHWQCGLGNVVSYGWLYDRVQFEW